MNDTLNEMIVKMTSTRESASKYAHKQGDAERSESRKEWSLIHASTLLMKHGLTIDWVGTDLCPIGYETIWEYCAGEYFGGNAKSREKIPLAIEHASFMRNGFNRLKERLFEEWGYVLLTVPRTINRQQIVVITLDSSYVVNSEGQTAHDIQLMRDEKLVRGQLRSSFHRSARLIGVDEARNSMDSILSTIALQPLASPRGNQIASPDSFNQQSLLESA